MRLMILRTIVLLLLLALAMGLMAHGMAVRSVTNQFLETENDFREDRTRIVSGWVDLEPDVLTRIAQNALGTEDLLDVRDAFLLYRKAQESTVVVDDYFYRPGIDADREIAKARLAQIVMTSKDSRLIVQAATLLGDLYAQDAMFYVKQKNSRMVKEAYGNAVEAFTVAIVADSTDTINQDAKEDLEALIRFFMGGSESEGEKPMSGTRGGTSEPGEGY